MSIIRNYFSDVWQILTRPSSFFDRMPTRGNVSWPLAFALVTHWVGVSFEFIWNAVFVRSGTYRFFQSILQFSQNYRNSSDIDYAGRSAEFVQMKDRMTEWLLGAGPIVIDPFLTLVSVLFTSFLVYLGARILVSPGKEGHPAEITYESALRIICFGMTPAILASIPLIGGMLASFGVIIVTITGAKRVYRISTNRAILVALFPKVLLFGIIVMGLLFFAVSLFKLFSFLL